MSDLVDLDPREAIEMYLNARASECREATLESHRYRLTPFASFCETKGIESLADLTGRDLHAFKAMRQSEVAPQTLQSAMSTLRQYMRFAERVDAVPAGFSEKVHVPSVEQTSRETRIERDRAEDILDYLGTYEYASRRHALFALVWHTGMRIGGVRAINLDDLELDDDELPHVKIRHRPEQGTNLKNGDGGNRDVGLKPWCVAVLRDYIEVNREPVDGEPRPLFTTRDGRISEGYVRREFYNVTERNGEKTPPHDVRRGSISDHLARGWPLDDVAERVNATPRVLRKHYDVRTEREAMLSRSSLFTEETDA